MNIYDMMQNLDRAVYDFKIMLMRSVYDNFTTAMIAKNLEEGSDHFTICSVTPNSIEVRRKTTELKKMNVYKHDTLFYDSFVATAFRTYLAGRKDKIVTELQYNAMPFTFDEIMGTSMGNCLYFITLTVNGFIIHM